MENPEVKKLTPSQYWEWRSKIEELLHGELKVRHARQTYSLMEKDIEIAKLRTAIYKQTLKVHEDNQVETKKSYDELKKRLEDELGVSLNGTAIDEITFEIRPLEEKS